MNNNRMARRLAALRATALDLRIARIRRKVRTHQNDIDDMWDALTAQLAEIAALKKRRVSQDAIDTLWEVITTQQSRMEALRVRVAALEAAQQEKANGAQ
jgi:uncharacterized protein YydD (DUF2326 family)